MNYKSVLNNVVYLDIETTGLDPLSSEIIEIGAIKIKDFIQSEISILIKPLKDVPKGIYHLCEGLRKEDLDNGYELQEAKIILKQIHYKIESKNLHYF